MEGFETVNTSEDVGNIGLVGFENQVGVGTSSGAWPGGRALTIGSATHARIMPFKQVRGRGLSFSFNGYRAVKPLTSSRLTHFHNYRNMFGSYVNGLWVWMYRDNCVWSPEFDDSKVSIGPSSISSVGLPINQKGNMLFEYDASRSQWLISYNLNQNTAAFATSNDPTPQNFTPVDIGTILNNKRIGILEYIPDSGITLISSGPTLYCRPKVTESDTVNIVTTFDAPIIDFTQSLTQYHIITESGGFYSSDKTDGLNWTLNTNFSITLNSITSNGQGTIIVASDNGKIWKSYDTGVNWEEEQLVISNKVWCKYGNGTFLVYNPATKQVFRSSDGTTWTLSKLATDWATDPNYTINALTYKNGWFRASLTNEGYTAVWSQDGINWNYSQYDLESSGSWYTGFSDLTATGAVRAGFRTYIASRSLTSQNAFIYAAYNNTSTSLDTGVIDPSEKFRRYSGTMRHVMDNRFKVDLAIDDDVVYSSEFQFDCRGISDVGMSTDGQTIIVSSQETSTPCLFISRDGGSSWILTNPTLPITTSKILKVGISRNGQSMVLLCSDSNMFKSVDGGNNWTNIALYPHTTSRVAILCISNDGETILTGGGNGNATYPYISKDGGATFSVAFPGLPSGYYGVSMDASDNIYITSYATTGGFQGLQKSVDRGVTWTQLNGSYNFRLYVRSMSVSNDGTVIAFACFNNQGVHVSKDGGLSWNMTQPTDSECRVSGDGSTIVSHQFGSGYVVNVDGSTGLQQFTLPQIPQVSCINGDGSIIYVTSTTGVFSTRKFKDAITYDEDALFQLYVMSFLVGPGFTKVDDLVITDFQAPNSGDIGEARIFNIPLDENVETQWRPVPDTLTNVVAGTSTPTSQHPDKYVESPHIGDVDVYGSSTVDIPTTRRIAAVAVDTHFSRTFPTIPSAQIGIQVGNTTKMADAVEVTPPAGQSLYTSAIYDVNPDTESGWNIESVKQSKVVIKKVE